jgi:hypothetical protein
LGTMPGLIRGIARVAAIAGTATAVSNRVSRRQGKRWAAKEEEQRQDAPPAKPVPGRDTVAQLKDLADLKAQGVLTDAEFDAEKAKILAS